MKIKKSLKNIFPSTSQKEKMLQDICKTKKIKLMGLGNIVYKSCILTAFVLLFVIFTDKSDVVTPINTRSSLEISYNDKCYMQVIGNYTLGDELESVSINSINYKVFENKDDTKTIVLFNEYYSLYVECEE